MGGLFSGIGGCGHAMAACAGTVAPLMGPGRRGPAGARTAGALWGGRPGRGGRTGALHGCRPKACTGALWGCRPGACTGAPCHGQALHRCIAGRRPAPVHSQRNMANFASNTGGVLYCYCQLETLHGGQCTSQFNSYCNAWLPCGRPQAVGTPNPSGGPSVAPQIQISN